MEKIRGPRVGVWLAAGGLILLMLGVYLNRSYGRIYNFIKAHQVVPSGGQHQIISARRMGPNTPTLTYIALGDSLTAGVGTNEIAASYPYRLGQYWSEQKLVKLINLATPGARTADITRLQLPELVQTQNIDRITLLIGINDIHHNLPLTVFKNNYRELLKRLEQAVPGKTTVLTIPYLGDPKLFLPPYKSYFDYQTKRFNTIIRAVAAEQGIPVIDLYNLPIESEQQKPHFYSPDLFHPSAEGYAWWARAIYDHFGT